MSQEHTLSPAAAAFLNDIRHKGGVSLLEAPAASGASPLTDAHHELIRLGYVGSTVTGHNVIMNLTERGRDYSAPT